MSVDNFVDKHPLTAREARFYAGFNKMLNRQAIIYPFKINDLQIDVNDMKNIPEKFRLIYFLHFLCISCGWRRIGKFLSCCQITRDNVALSPTYM
jgi:hypothetical protein